MMLGMLVSCYGRSEAPCDLTYVVQPVDRKPT